MNQENYDLIVIGGGAAGFFGAISCAELSRQPLRIAILEGGARPLAKVKISGGGRCNVTHNCFDPKILVRHYPRGGKRLLNGFYKFGPPEMIAWLNQRGVEVVAEGDGRMFPSTNTSQTIVDCFLTELERQGIDLCKGELVKSIVKTDAGFSIETKKRTLTAKAVLLTTGGMPQGHALAQSLGHTITPLAPSLFTFQSTDPLIEDMAGVSVADAEVTLSVGGETFGQRGPVLITHWGYSGPAVLKLSAFAARHLAQANYQAKFSIHWLPAFNREQIFNRLRELRTSDPRKKLSSLPFEGLTKRLWTRLIGLVGLEQTVCGEVSDKAWRKLAEMLVACPCRVEGKGVFKEEFVTCGGVDLDEVDLKSFQSKLCPGLYFAGEILDVDGVTGGFNFQNAWTSSRMVALDLVGRLS